MIMLEIKSLRSSEDFLLPADDVDDVFTILYSYLSSHHLFCVC